MIDALIKKYEDMAKAKYSNTGKNIICDEILQDLKQLKESIISKELEYHHQLQDEINSDKYTKIDNAFIDGKRFALNELTRSDK